jgi:hypothetical protein
MTYILRVRRPPGKRKFTILKYSVLMYILYKDKQQQQQNCTSNKKINT